MLVSLHVKNLALIDETEVEFGEGLNILSGETGAGKSIIIGSIHLALGARTDKDKIRAGAEYAFVELVFQIQQEDQRRTIEAMDIPLEEDGLLIIQRKIMPQKSICKICGETVTAKACKDLASLLIHIYGQHEHQTLLDKRNYLTILDEYAREDMDKMRTKLETAYNIYHKLSTLLLEHEIDEASKNRELSLLEYELNEIEQANLQPEEEVQLEREYEKMLHSFKIGEATSQAYGLTSSTQGASDFIGRAVRELTAVIQYDEELAVITSQLEEVDSLLTDVNHELAIYQDQLECDDSTFKECEERLNLIHHIKAKYGNTVEEINEYYEEQKKRYEKLVDYDAYKAQLKVDYNEAAATLEQLCAQARTLRMKHKVKLEQGLRRALEDLNFMSVSFEIQIKDKTQMSAKGYDEIDFLISTNVGEALRPLGQVASGGELSRIMLGLKTILANKGQVDTLIFDEIDAGISGKTAWKVARKLALLAKENQVICITHLPQIAAMADYHYKIAKEENKKQTITTIVKLQEQEMLEELARLLSGDVITEAVLENAKELKELAIKTKDSKVI